MRVDQDNEYMQPVYYKRSVSYSLGKIIHSNKVDGGAAFSHALYSYSLKHGNSVSTIQSLFSGLWLSFQSLIAAIFVTYLDYHGTFYRFQLCHTCGRPFIPERLGNDRGKYCGPDCQKKKYATKPVNKCYRNQRDCIGRVSEKLKKWQRDGCCVSLIQVVDPVFPSKQSICQVEKCPHGVPDGVQPPGGGKCTEFRKANAELLSARDECAKKRKKAKKGR